MRPVIIVAMSETGLIGCGDRLPWRSKRDMAHFVKETMGKYLLLGRKTYQGIPKELKGRDVLILSSDPEFKPSWGRKVSSIEEVEKIVGDEELMVAGGAKVYELMLPLAQKMIITYINNPHGNVSASSDSVYFPEFNFNQWVEEKLEFFAETEEEPLLLTISTLIKAENVFLSADHHLGETRMEIMQRPFSGPVENAEFMVSKHNEIVKPHDLVFMLGDIINKDADPNIWLPWIDKFNGRKILFRGNHERHLTDEQLLKYFQEIVPEGDGRRIDFSGIKCFLTHYPTSGTEDCFNIVGHIHGAWKVQLNSLNVGVDANHFRPVPSTKIPFFLRAISDFFDEDVWSSYDPINMLWRGKRGKAGRYFSG